MPLAASLFAVSLVLLVAAAAGFAAAAAFVPVGRVFERAGWGVALGIAALAASAAVGLALPGVSPRLLAAVVLGLLAAVPLRLRLVDRLDTRSVERSAALDAILAAAVGAGLLLYLLRALTEPMWSNDYLAIWGLKAKTIFATRSLPPWPFRDPAAGFSHPEYPIGLPLALAGIAGILGRWDDHATALLFPVLQAATIAVLFGWLTRRGASRRVALAASALVALCEPLYSAFLTGMAEIPLAGALLLVATSWCDALDGTDGGAVRRLAAASLFAAACKNEGVFFAAAAGAWTLAAPRSSAGPGRRAAIAAACAVPATALFAAHRLVLGAARMRDFDPGLLAPGRVAELAPRVAAALAAVGDVVWRPAWPALACLAVIFLAGRRQPAADRILGLAATALAAYLALPLLAVRGPEWLIRTTLPRTAAALAPAVAAALALRVAALSGASGRDEASAAARGRAESESRDARPTPSTRAS